VTEDEKRNWKGICIAFFVISCIVTLIVIAICILSPGTSHLLTLIRTFSLIQVRLPVTREPVVLVRFDPAKVFILFRSTTADEPRYFIIFLPKLLLAIVNVPPFTSNSLVLHSSNSFFFIRLAVRLGCAIRCDRKSTASSVFGTIAFRSNASEAAATRRQMDFE
jgi:hypothetical protein